MSTAKTKTPQRPRAKLPPLLVRIALLDGSTKIVELPDPREDWCRSYNRKSGILGRERIAEPVAADERRFKLFHSNWNPPGDNGDDPMSLVAFPELNEDDGTVYDGEDGYDGRAMDRAEAFATAAKLNKATVAKCRREGKPLNDGIRCGEGWWIVVELGQSVTPELNHAELDGNGDGFDRGGCDREIRAVKPTKEELKKYPNAARPRDRVA